MVLNSGISWNMTYTTINGTKKMYPHLLYLTAFLVKLGSETCHYFKIMVAYGL